LELPAQTAWLALCQVDKHSGLELLLSSATGLTYLQQNHGVFESQPRPLVQASQVFTNSESPRLLRLKPPTNGTNLLLPVISASQVVLYQQNSAGEWSPGLPLPLQAERTQWSIEPGEWSM